jgi:hypothetical protein
MDDFATHCFSESLCGLPKARAIDAARDMPTMEKSDAFPTRIRRFSDAGPTPRFELVLAPTLTGRVNAQPAEGRCSASS